MTVTQIRAFIAVVQHCGFTAAARALSTSQTTITSQIQALEQEHGVELFYRRGRRVELSAVGAKLSPVPDERLRPVRIEGGPVTTHIHVCCLRERRESRLVASFFDAVSALGQPALSVGPMQMGVPIGTRCLEGQAT